MKKFIAALLAGLTLFTLVGCSGGSKANSSTPKDYSQIIHDARSDEDNEYDMIFTKGEDGKFTAIDGYSAEYEADQLNEEIRDILMPLLNLEDDQYTAFAASISSMMVRSYAVAIVKPAEGKTDEAARVMQEYKAACKGTDTAYQLEISYLRSVGELDKAREHCTEALKEYGTSPEIYRQSALIYLMNGDYDNAYEDAYEADYAAYQIYQYTGDNSAYTQELSNTIYLCSWLCKEKGKKDTDNAAYIDEILSSFSESEISDSVLQIIKGDKTLEEVLMKGECDLI